MNKNIEKYIDKCADKIQKKDGISSVVIIGVHEGATGFCTQGNPTHILISLLSAYHNVWKKIDAEEIRKTIYEIEKNLDIEVKNSAWDKFLKINNLIKESGIK